MAFYKTFLKTQAEIKRQIITSAIESAQTSEK